MNWAQEYPRTVNTCSPVTQDQEASHSFTDPCKSSASRAWLSRSLFPLRTQTRLTSRDFVLKMFVSACSVEGLYCVGKILRNRVNDPPSPTPIRYGEPDTPLPTSRKGVALEWFDTACWMASRGANSAILHIGEVMFSILHSPFSTTGHVAPTVSLHCFFRVLYCSHSYDPGDGLCE